MCVSILLGEWHPGLERLGCGSVCRSFCTSSAVLQSTDMQHLFICLFAVRPNLYLLLFPYWLLFEFFKFTTTFNNLIVMYSGVISFTLLMLVLLFSSKLENLPQIFFRLLLRDSLSPNTIHYISHSCCTA